MGSWTWLEAALGKVTERGAMMRYESISLSKVTAS